LAKVSVGESVKEQFDLDMKLEQEAVERLVNGIKVCDDNKDVGSRLLLEEILKSEEDHIDWLDSQIELIRQVGEQNYLAEQIRKS
jgi:bacterioferritin